MLIPVGFHRYDNYNRRAGERRRTAYDNRQDPFVAAFIGNQNRTRNDMVLNIRAHIDVEIIGEIIAEIFGQHIVLIKRHFLYYSPELETLFTAVLHISELLYNLLVRRGYNAVTIIVLVLCVGI